MGRPSLAEPRRRQIVDGLRTAIVKHGLADASVQRIAGYAGVPAGLIHHYFVSKEDLLMATLDRLPDSARQPEANVALATMVLCLLYGADALLLSDRHAIHPRRLRRCAGELVARFRGMTHGKTDARATPHDRDIRSDRARRPG